MSIFDSNDCIFSNEEFYISYNAGPGNLARTLDLLITGGSDNIGRDETALCLKQQEDKLFGVRFYILYGDHREAYRKLIPDYAACYRYFLSHPEIWGHTSDHPEHTEQLRCDKSATLLPPGHT